MLSRRVIVCLDVRDGRVVKGTQFVALRDVGDPAELAERYERAGADEIVFLDIRASQDRRAAMLDVVRETAARLFIPLTVGGGMKSETDVACALRAGADKVAINSAAIDRPEVLTEAATRFGTQCIVASIDAKRDGAHWTVWTHGGTRPSNRDAVQWARECVSRGAGEILLTSIDRDGARAGYDLELTRAVADAVTVPVVASGGAGDATHCRDALAQGRADAVLVAGALHDGVTSIRAIKTALARAGLPIRMVA